ncbi:Ubiquinone biosynthesis methyltransferase coq5, mitochondrial [Taphrina deformans PYCC 5710]|uniref:2-methoxy-6-polyprenyl-1,4-benzoquinol methylase, mitochondrial n=1 Tax=Taphrina deformans (strain PYCC 5710 / ATCC 11124 / CBS 356.35 / IMI 108563 / JCM 9778 / NBRC 8474) TaxID=1097556 RepID=R4X7Y8_TAPDE|nr:Ubiquinone biosynthesis methyltransferase coq5, mitochondrial [Taphrina deformans PYCC 5710]|eukprot:CCG81580.1 Ubiquinone biosynthesis methyltransferase coq5, mitochondrial [Taphrina deformans PYCC 5710]
MLAIRSLPRVRLQCARAICRSVSTQTPPPSNDDKSTHFGFQTVPEAIKESLVGKVFSSVASSYDRMNDVMSLGIHRLWKDDFVRTLNPGSRGNFAPMSILDVAGGTGDIAFRHLDHATDINFDHETTVQVVDINPEMLKFGEKRALETRYKDSGRISFKVQNAEKMTDIPSESVDLYTIAFGIRNCTHIDQVLSEAYRVLKPGGVFACLEFSSVKPAPLAALYQQYSFSVIPIMGQIVAGDRDSYQYLVESIAKFPNQEKFAQMIKDAGFLVSGKGYRDLTFGVAAIHTGVKSKTPKTTGTTNAAEDGETGEVNESSVESTKSDKPDLKEEPAKQGEPAVIAS